MLIPEPSTIVLIGPSGSGKSTLARTWPASYRLELDFYRLLVSGSAGDQGATSDAVRAMDDVLAARVARGLTCVIDATNTRADVRRGFTDLAHAHELPAVALVMDTPLPLCQARNALRPQERQVPYDEVQRQAEQIAAARPQLRGEGFDHVVLSSQLNRLRPLLQRASYAGHSQITTADGTAPDLARMFADRIFGSDIAKAFTWQQLEAGRDPIAHIAVGRDRLVLTYRTTPDDPSEWGFEAQVPCPNDGCNGPAWLPVWTATHLLQAYDGDIDDDDIACDTCGVGAIVPTAV
ncbi:AAA family ATPase [Actinacidiphila glaucinigra]|uniref:AAA family ATPase n=1 Tax=Actinacidiphila glaucinigra TaxID=235986 RepID=UPI0036A58811